MEVIEVYQPKVTEHRHSLIFEMPNVGTVPTFKMHNFGIAPTHKTHNLGTELSYAILVTKLNSIKLIQIR